MNYKKIILSTDYIIEMKLPNVSKLFTLQNVLILLVVLILGYALYSYSTGKTLIMDSMEDGKEETEEEATVPVASEANMSGSAYAQKPVANPTDLLPSDANSKWGELSVSNSVNTPDLLQAGYHNGIDTVGQTLRNANQQLRSDPPITKQNVGPWHNSTIEPDLARVPLELGAVA